MQMLKHRVKRNNNLFFKIYDNIRNFCLGPRNEQVESEYIFRYHKNLKSLNLYFYQSRLKYMYLINFVAFYGICFATPVVSFFFYDPQNEHVPGGYLPLGMFGGYTLTVMAFETWVTIRIIQIMNANLEPDSIKILRTFSLKSYLINIFLSQIEKVDFYFDVLFTLDAY